MVSLKDIASATGVSIRTVSRALNDSGYVAAAKKAEIVAAAARLGYCRNRAAVALRTGRSSDVAAIMTSLDELHVAKLAACEQVLRDHGYTLSVLFAPAEDGDGWAEVVEHVRARGSAGAVVLPPVSGPGATLTRHLGGLALPLVAVDIRAAGIPVVAIDRPSGVVEAVQHLLATGRRRIAYVGPHEPNRINGFRRAVDDAGQQPLLLTTTPGEQFATGRRAAAALLAMKPSVDAVQAYSDVLAMGLLAGLHDAGARVPDDVAVIGFDDRRCAALAAPPMTTVAQPNRAAGAIAAQWLLERIGTAASPAEPEPRTLPTRLVIRETT